MTETRDLEEILNRIGLHVPNIWLPRHGIDMTKWAVVAPDQYKLQPGYWGAVEKFVRDAPSTLNLIFPEAFTGLRNFEDAKKNIWAAGRKYIEDGTLQSQGECFVLVDRTLPSGKSRKGLVVALDLEKYGPNGLIRPTEATIPKGIEVRKGIREGSVGDFPHSIILVKDPLDTLIGPLFEEGIEEKLYDFKLMMEGGRIKGYKISNPSTMARIAENIIPLFCNGFWGLHGDGHHEVGSGDPLVEIINVYSEGLEFYPIHRAVFNINPKEMLGQMKSFYEGKGFIFNSETYNTKEDMQIRLEDLRRENRHLIGYVAQNEYGILIIENPKLSLEVKTLQSFLDEYKRHNGGAVIEYPHEEMVVTSKGLEPNKIGFYLPSIPKNIFFEVVGHDGILTPKVFSIGEPNHKRFLVEGILKHN